MASVVGHMQLCAETMSFSQNIPNGTISLGFFSNTAHQAEGQNLSHGYPSALMW